MDRRIIQPGISLGHHDRAVPEYLLKGWQAATRFQEPAGERMPELVKVPPPAGAEPGKPLSPDRSREVLSETRSRLPLIQASSQNTRPRFLTVPVVMLLLSRDRQADEIGTPES